MVPGIFLHLIFSLRANYRQAISFRPRKSCETLTVSC